MQIKLLRTNSEDENFKQLVGLLDLQLAEINGDMHNFYHQYNKIDAIKHAIVLFADDIAIACGAMKTFDETSMEIKRMYTFPLFRGMGMASILLRDLEDWARELGYSRCLLETGKSMRDATALYLKNGYHHIQNYGQYIGNAESVCFEKNLGHTFE